MSHIEEAFGKVLFEFPVLYKDWEGDSTGWVVRNRAGEIQIVMSSHARLYVAEPEELAEKIAEYQAAIDKTRSALKMLAATV